MALKTEHPSGFSSDFVKWFEQQPLDVVLGHSKKVNRLYRQLKRQGRAASPQELWDCYGDVYTRFREQQKQEAQQ